MKFLVTLEKDEDGYYVTECPSLPGCVSQGQTPEEALANIRSGDRGVVRLPLLSGREVGRFSVEHVSEILRFAQNDRADCRSKKLNDYLDQTVVTGRANHSLGPF